jgi:hypothetical protein
MKITTSIQRARHFERYRQTRMRDLSWFGLIVVGLFCAIGALFCLAGCGGGETRTIIVGVMPLPICPAGTVGVSACGSEPKGMCVGPDGGTISGCAIDKMPAFACVEACP